MFNWIKSLFNTPAPAKDHEPGPTPDPQPTTAPRDPDDPAYKKTHDAIQAYWEKIGTVDSDVISYLINPAFMGSPPWPGGRQAFKIIRTSNSLIIASDGLSDPFDEDADSQRNGFEMEIYIEVKSQQDMTFDDIKNSAAFALIEQCARQIAEWGGITTLLDQIKIISSEIPVPNGAIPETFLNQDGYVGVLFGMEAVNRPAFVPNTPLSPVRMVAVTALSPAEVQDIAMGKLPREQMAQMLMDAGHGPISDFHRDSLV